MVAKAHSNLLWVLSIEGDRKGLEDALSQLRGTNWAETGWLKRVEQAVENGMPCSEAIEVTRLLSNGHQYEAGKRLDLYHR